jgi:predicted permease
MWRDLLHAGKSLAKSRAFTIVCVLSLGIGMAPVIGIQYALRAFTTPPPTVNTDGLVELLTQSVGPRRAADKWSYADFVDLRNAATGAELAGWTRGDTDVTLPDSGKTAAQTLFVSSNYFRMVGVALARGPGFPALKNDTADPLVIVAHRFWQRQLGSDPDTVGKMLSVNGVPHTVAGIAADGFEGHYPAQEAQLFIPLERHPSLLADSNRRFDRSRTWVHIHGRLAPGVSVAQASAAVSAFTAQLAKAYPATNESTAGVAAPYHPLGHIEGEDFPIVRAVFNVLTVIPLLVVCLNISGMVQVRSAMRERELSIRQAIGASRRRLMQHLLAEAVVLAVLGGTLASLVLFNAPPIVSWWTGEPLPNELQRAFSVDVPRIAILAGLCLATSLVFGWLPALRFSRPAVMTVLKDETGGGGTRAGRVHRVTSALQVAIAVPPLVLSAMALERVRATASADLGFAADQVYAAPVEPGAGPGEHDGQLRRLRDVLASTSGVASVTVADGLPLDSRYRLARLSKQTDAQTAPKVVHAHVTRVGEAYLDTMGSALIGGRSFTFPGNHFVGFRGDDAAGAPLVTVVSKALADNLFPGGDAIGQRLTFESGDGTDTKTRVLAIVGVSADFPTAQINTDREQLLLPLSQHPDVRRDSVGVSDDREGTPRLMLIARAAPGEPPAKLQAALENTIREVKPDFDRASIVTAARLRQDSVSDFLNQSTFSGIGGGVALLLAALGIYGVVGLMVTTRTREMAVRVTLGASRARLIGMVLFGVIRLVAPGVVAGALITFALVRLEGGIALSNIEPLAYVAGAAIALITAVLAGLAPARRAASVQPMAAMRST